jgi:hypothetical protein
LNKEIHFFNLFNEILENERNGDNNKERQMIKYANKQYEYNTKEMKDQNAHYHHLNITYRLEKEQIDKIKADLLIKKRTTGSTKIDETIRNPVENMTGFEFLYAKYLIQNQVYNKDRLENPQKFLMRNRVREFNNLGRSHPYEGRTGMEKMEHVKNLTERISEDPLRGKII